MKLQRKNINQGRIAFDSTHHIDLRHFSVLATIIQDTAEAYNLNLTLIISDDSDKNTKLLNEFD